MKQINQEERRAKEKEKPEALNNSHFSWGDGGKSKTH